MIVAALEIAVSATGATLQTGESDRSSCLSPLGRLACMLTSPFLSMLATISELS